MGARTKIEWTSTINPDGTVTPGATWNPVRGCSRVSEGCRNCYAETVAARFSGPGQPYEGLAQFRVIGAGTPKERREAHWTGKVRLVPEHLEDPLRWKKPRRIFVNSMSDLFHEGLSDRDIARVFETMCRSIHDRPRERRHTYQILTKRPARMLEWFAWAKRESPGWFNSAGQLDLGNVWIGVSVEDQAAADERIPLLLQSPAKVHFLSCEPLLGPVTLWEWSDWNQRLEGPAIVHDYRRGPNTANGPGEVEGDSYPGADWVIVGGESGPGARPSHPDWFRSLRDQCQAAGVPFHFKQWGAFGPVWTDPSPVTTVAGEDIIGLGLLGKKAAGRTLDGRTWDEFPAVA